MTPEFFQAEGQAMRSFGDAVNNPEHLFGQHPEHFTLYVLGEFDAAMGVITGKDLRALANGKILQTNGEPRGTDEITGPTAVE